MRLLIVRHGEAETSTNTDAERCLTAKGEDDIFHLGARLASENVGIDRVCHSPYVRAQQSCEKLLQSLNIDRHRVEMSALITPNGHVDEVFEYLDVQQKSGVNTIMLVSHQPLVSTLLARLLDANAARAYVYPMMPASIADIECEQVLPGTAMLKRLLSPPYGECSE